MDPRFAMQETNVREVDNLTLDQILGSTEKVVVVEFYMTNCPICQQLVPTIEELAGELAEEAVFTKVDAEENLDLALQYGVQVTPTFKLFCGRRFLGEIIGDTNATVLRNTVRDLIRHRSCGIGKGKVNYEMDGYG